MKEMLRKHSFKRIAASTGLSFLFVAMIATTALTSMVNAAIDAPVDKYGFGVALFKNDDPWNYPANEEVLKMYGTPYDVYNSSDIGNVDLSRYAKVVIASDQNQVFYDTVNASRAWFEEYASNGGVLEIHAADSGWNGGNWIDLLPGGITYTFGYYDTVDIVRSRHPVVRTPNSITDNELDTWGYSVHGYFDSPYPSGYIEIFELGVSPFRPVYIEVPHGSGIIIASSQTLEFAYWNDNSFVLENCLLYLAPYEKLDLEVNVGTVHFRGEIAEFYLETSLHGNAINASIWDATLYYESGTQQIDLMANVEIITVGLYRITYTIPADAVAGTYTLSLEARFRTGMTTATGHATASFIISPTLTSQNSYIVDIKDDIATIVIPNLDTIKANLDTIKVNLTEIHATIVGIDGKIVTIQTDIGTIEADIGTVQTSLDDIDESVGEIDETTTPTYCSIGSTILAALATVVAIIIVVLVKKKPA
jgi:hypothetical protein